MNIKVSIIGFLIFASISHLSAQQSSAQKDPAEEKANAVSARLKLDEEKKNSVYKIFAQTDKRIADLEFGTPDYTKLVNYINQERKDMLQTTLSPKEFSEYQKNFATRDQSEISKYISQNNTFMNKKAAEELKAKKDEDKQKNSEKVKAKKEEDKQKAQAKKDKEKQKAADAKAKGLEKKEKDKTKAADKKQKEQEKKEKDKMKAAEKKQKEQEKKETAKQKALEKKQKELEKKLNKKK